MSRRALVAGASRQECFYLVAFLLARDYEVHAQSRHADTTLSFLHHNSHRHAVDICDFDALHALIAEVQPDEIYNLASISRPSISWEKPHETAKINEMIPQQI